MLKLARGAMCYEEARDCLCDHTVNPFTFRPCEKWGKGNGSEETECFREEHLYKTLHSVKEETTYAVVGTCQPEIVSPWVKSWSSCLA